MSNQNALVLTSEVTSAFAPEVIKVIRNTYCPTATDAEFVLFAHKAASFGLDPFKNEIFFIKYGNAARIQFAAEAYLTRAREHTGFQPPDTQVVCDNDDFKVRKVNGEWEILSHEVSFPRGNIIGAYSIAYRDGYRPVTVLVEKNHIAHLYKGQNKDNWDKWEPDMIGKFAQQRALKVQYGINFGSEDAEGEGIQPSVNNVESFSRVDVTPADKPAEALKEPQQTKKPEDPKKEPQQDANKDMEAARKLMTKKFGILGIDTKEGKGEYIASKIKLEEGHAPTYEQMKDLLKIMDEDIKKKNTLSDELE